MTDCTISGNSCDQLGGGLLNLMGTITVSGCTISGNSAGLRGSGLDNVGTATLTDCTISGNSVSGFGSISAAGGLSNGGTATITGCTVSGNSCSNESGGLYNGGTATITNTIVAGNSAAGGASDITGARSVTGSYNLIGTGGSGGLSAANNNQLNIADPGLGAPGAYGGPTLTYPLLPGSPAIGKGTAVGGVTTDQRGFSRGASVDIGAYQDQGFVLTPVAGSTPQSAGPGKAFAKPLAVTVTAHNSGEFTNPVAGGLVTFSAPATGASAVLSSTSPVTIGADGQASVTATANDETGTYQVTASTSGAATPAEFALTNGGVTISRIVQEGDYAAVTFTNGTSNPVEINIADYSIHSVSDPFDPSYPQKFYAATSTSLGPGQTETIKVELESGANQVDAFTGGPVITSFTTYPNYSGYHLSYAFLNNSVGSSGGVGHGDTATSIFWASPQGQRLIDGFDKTVGGETLGQWLQGDFPNLFAGFASKSDSQVAGAFEASVLNLTYSQVFSTALSIFATDTLLNTGSAGQALATGDGFHVEAGGSSYKTYDVGDGGTAIGLSNDTSYTLYQIVSAADRNAAGVILQPTPGDALRDLAIDGLFAGINNAGGII